MATRTLHLVRHAQHKRLPYDGPENELTLEQANQLDGGLTGMGREQAMLTAQRFRGTPVNAVHSSSLPRALQTAEIIAQEFPNRITRTTRSLWECVPSAPPEFTGTFSEVPLEEPWQGRDQAEKAFATYFKPARGASKHDILVCHGNIIRYFVTRVLQIDVESWVNMITYNCGITRILIQSDGWMALVSYNDVGHLPRYLWTHT
jgi:serine/threonine-protein phosphatase PGAM5